MEDLPTGFRFYPTEEELVSFYLRNKLRGERPDINLVIPVVNIYLHRPWELPQLAGVVGGHGECEQWFYFVAGPENMARGGKPNRLTTEGYWKATGSPGLVFSLNNNRVIGEKRTMVFYTGRAPNGTKTEWKINEYKAVRGDATSASTPLSNLELCQEFSLCRLYKKSKCDRAFDRRPLDLTAIRRRRIAQPPPPQDNVHTTAIIVEDPESTGAGRISPTGAAVIPSNNATVTRLHWDNFEPIWDWEDCFSLL
ncbi:PREDICTED: NAC domain-containing protein 90-like [Ipomoea nil]|uniref:NAC domain-containing protein 90-like n=1 Tax=Ipomoea nil TaxID=35883 RepID=UPI0009010DCB|nr:PREDICTED: NAC domain-containing protein 90-like [Ipomoea nil]